MRSALFALLFGAGLAVASASATTPALKARTDATTILDDIEDAITCDACEALLLVLQVVAHLGNDDFVDLITDVCELIGDDPDAECAGAIALEGPILAHDLRYMTVPSTTSQLFCTTVFGLCDIPAVTPYNVTFPTPKPDTSRPTSSGETPIKVVHISDIHVDLSYEVGADGNCSYNICCRNDTSTEPLFTNSDPAGVYGNHGCDSPLTLEESMYAAINDLVSDAVFTIFTGDVVEGAVWATTDAQVEDDLNDAYVTRMQSYLSLVYPVIGNHDCSPVNSFPPADIDTTISSQYVYDTLSADWETWIGSDAAETVLDYGAYSVLYADGNLRFISFNSMLYYKENFWLYEADLETDPSGQLAWLVDELSAAEEAGERVWLMGHMPMGSSDALYDGSNYFNQIINRYDATIAANFFGHTHKDEFEISYSDYDDQTYETAVMNSYIAPALTPTSGNPTFRVYSVDPVTFGILDFTVYIANMSAADYQTDPVWEEYYSAKAAYGSLLEYPVTDAAAELTPAFWHNVTQLFLDDTDVFDAYYARKSRGYDVDACTGDCITDEVCQLRAAEAQYNCVAVTPGVDFKRDLLVEDDFHAECGGSTFARMMKKAAGSDLEGLKRLLTRKLK